MKPKFLTKEQLQQKRIEELIWRTNQEVLKVMERIPKGELFSYKLEKNNTFPHPKDKGRKQALEEVEKVIDELEVRPELDEGTQFYPYVYSKELKSKIKEMEK